MEKLHMSMEELRRKFIEDRIQIALAEAFPIAMKQNIHKVPRAERHKLRKEIRRLKKNPMLLYDDDGKSDLTPASHNATEESTPIDRESVSYKAFENMFETFSDYFANNKQNVAEMYKEIYTELNIELIVTQ